MLRPEASEDCGPHAQRRKGRGSSGAGREDEPRRVRGHAGGQADLS